MKNKEDINNSAFYYSVNMLRHLLKMNLITEDEYNRIVRISSEYYSTKNYCVLIFFFSQYLGVVSLFLVGSQNRGKRSILGSNHSPTVSRSITEYSV